MDICRVAILGCGTVGGGVARIMQDLKQDLSMRAGMPVDLIKIVDLNPAESANRHGINRDLFCGTADTITPEEASSFISEIIHDKDIDVVVETIGGTSDFLLDIVKKLIAAGKHVVTANKALLALYNSDIFTTAEASGVQIGYEAAVCGAIPIIKTIQESYSGDKIQSISGIFNGTSNYILSKMKEEGLTFDDALAIAQEKGYAEQDPTYDINGYDAGHKLLLLIKLAFGLDLAFEDIAISGIEDITDDDLDAAQELDSTIKLICYAEKRGEKVFATVRPMMVKNSNFLSQISGATNAVRLINMYAGEQILIGKGAGSLETASSIVADIVFLARNQGNNFHTGDSAGVSLMENDEFELPYNITFDLDDVPGMTGLVATAIGNQGINIDTVGHNRHNIDRAVFPVATMPCSMNQIRAAIDDIEKKRPGVYLNPPKVVPILF
jgi:homoserine dehydrogenase